MKQVDRRLRAAAFEVLESRRLLAATVAATSPTNGAQNVSLVNDLTITFGSAMNAATLDGTTIELRSPDNVVLGATYSYNSTTKALTVNPTANLVSGSGYYFVTVKGGTSGVKETGGGTLVKDVSFAFTTATPNFTETAVFSGLSSPTAVEFSPDGRVFVAEKRGVIRVYDNLTDTTPEIFADLRTSTHNFWDRGLLGLALSPNFVNDGLVYVLYSYDGDIGGLAPKWGTAGADSDSGGSSPTGTGVNASARLSRLSSTGNVATGETVLINDWAEQFPSHSIGHLEFGPDGYLYASAGDGASFNYADYGQTANGFGDPTNEGGALRSQDILTTGDATTLDGTIIRINPATGLGAPGNPYSGDANRARIVANGLRNPFRFAFRPGTSEIWTGDVGWNDWEELNRFVTASGTPAAQNFGWPAYEGASLQGGYRAIGLPLLQQIYDNPSTVTAPYYTYKHSDKVVPGSAEPTGGSSITGVAFYGNGNYPVAYNGALFFADYSRKQIYVMYQGGNGLPDVSSRQVFRSVSGGAVELQMGPSGDLFYVDMNNGRIMRITATGANRTPTARFTATPTSGSAPLVVAFDGRTSTDPDAGDVLTYAWDLDGDGDYDDSTSATPSYTYTTAGTRLVRLKVTDRGGLTSTASQSVSADNGAPIPTITSPLTSLRWTVGSTISFAGGATDPEDGAIPASRLRWDVVLIHANDIDPSNTHDHPIQSFTGIGSGSFVAPDHEYPSWLELRLTATDSTGLSTTITQRLDPRTTTITIGANPTGGQLGFNGSVTAAPVTRTVIVGSDNTIGAPSPQIINGLSYVFGSWSDGGTSTHNITAGTSSATYTATYVRLDPPTAPGMLTATPIGANTVNLAWTDTSSNETGFQVQLKDAFDNWFTVVTLPAGTTSFTHTNLAAATSYTYRVRSTNAAGNTISNTAVATTADPSQTPYTGAPLPVPGRIEAEYFDDGGQNFSYFDLNTPNLGGAFRDTAVDLENTLDDTGNYNVGYFEAGEWMEYTIQVAATGKYTMNARMAGLLTGGSFHLEVDGVNLTGPVAIPATGGYQDWGTITKSNLTLTSGTHILRFVADTNTNDGSIGNFNWLSFDAEGEIVRPNAPTALTVSPITNTSARLIWTDNATNEAAFQIERQTGTTWSLVATVGANVTTFIDTALTPGATYSWRVRATNAAGDSNSTTPVTQTIPSVVQSPYAGSPAAVPGTIQIEDYDLGGNNVAYKDLDPTNNGGEYRGEGVDLQGTDDSGGGFNLGWAEAGEWLEYTIAVPSTGTYGIQTRVASLGLGGTFHYEVDGVAVTSSIQVPTTTGWQTFGTTTTGGLSLTAGTHILRLALDSNGEYGSVGNFNWFKLTGGGSSTSGDGLAVTYYNNADFTGTTVSRVDERIAFDFGYGSPDTAISRDTFSARWTGQILADKSETYTFHTRTDDGVRLWVNNVLLIDKWQNQAATEWSGSIALEAGKKYVIRMDYFEDTGGAAAELRWSSPSTAKQIVPRANLFSTTGSTPQSLSRRIVGPPIYGPGVTFGDTPIEDSDRIGELVLM